MKLSHPLVTVTAISLVAGAFSIATAQQTKAQQDKQMAEEAHYNVMFSSEAPHDHIQMLSMMAGFGGALVKNAPYSAQGTSEVTQTLSDGNRIHTTNTSQYYRDSSGRTRVEHTLNGVGPWNSEGVKTIEISDPVAGVQYVLEPSAKTASKMNRPTSVAVTGGLPHPMERKMLAETASNTKAANTSKEDLGTQTIDGVAAQGTRTTSVTPAGQVGNELPISVVSERWYSPDLQIDLKTVHTDPRFGQSTFQITNLTRAEPDPTLFQVPGDYTMIDNGPGKVVMRFHPQ